MNSYSHIIGEKVDMYNSVLKDKTIVLTGGGTGGHIYPNLALAEKLLPLGAKIVYLGGQGDTLERTLAKKNNLKYLAVDTIKFVRGYSFSALKNNFSIPSKLNKSVKDCVIILKNINASLVFSKGGFVSVPVVLAAKKLNIPIIAHESDISLGLGNKIAQKKGAIMLKGHPDANFKGEFVGIPLRNELFSQTNKSARQQLNIPQNEKVLLVIGGSSGAQALNDALINNLNTLLKTFYIIHVTGIGKEIAIPKAINVERYKQVSYAHNVSTYLNCADVILSRAGATAVFEISALKKRAVFVPLPKGVSRGDQPFNAELAQKYGASVLKQDENFLANFAKVISSSYKSAPMRPIINDTNGKIIEIICANLS